MDSSDLTQWTPRRGMSVYGSDDDKVGEVDAVEPDHVVVRKGFFFPDDHVIPISAVDSYDDDSLYLNVTREQALEQQWGSAPTAGHATTTAATEEPVSSYDSSASTGDMTQTVPTEATSPAGRTPNDAAADRLPRPPADPADESV